MEISAFEQLVEEALLSIPERFRQKMKNVVVVIEPHIRTGSRGARHIRQGGVLLGLYEGVPLTQRGIQYSLVPPDKITIFQETIESVAGQNETQIRQLVIDTVHHEVAHHFGMDEKRVRRWERLRQSKSAKK